MSDARDWVEELEARLERQLEAFLQANPEQEALLAEQEARDRQQRLGRLRLRLRQDAELQRQGLLRLAGEIRGWRQRVEKARAASADQLATRAEAHIGDLMDEGRNRWKSLEELGQRFTAVEQELSQLKRTAQTKVGRPGPGQDVGAGGKAGRDQESSSSAQSEASKGNSLEADWAAFEANQELEAMRRRMAR